MDTTAYFHLRKYFVFQVVVSDASVARSADSDCELHSIASSVAISDHHLPSDFGANVEGAVKVQYRQMLKVMD